MGVDLTSQGELLTINLNGRVSLRYCVPQLLAVHFLNVRGTGVV